MTEDIIPPVSEEEKKKETPPPAKIQTIVINGVTYGVGQALPGDYRYWGGENLVAGGYVPKDLPERSQPSPELNTLVDKLMKEDNLTHQEAIDAIQHISSGQDPFKGSAVLNRNPHLYEIIRDNLPGKAWEDLHSGIPVVATEEGGTAERPAKTTTMLLSPEKVAEIQKMTPEEQFKALKAMGIEPQDKEWLNLADEKGKIVGGILTSEQIKAIGIKGQAEIPLVKAGAIDASGRLNIGKAVSAGIIDPKVFKDAGYNVEQETINILKQGELAQSKIILTYRNVIGGRPYEPQPKPGEYTESEIKSLINSGMSTQELADAGADIPTINFVVGNIVANWENNTLPLLPDDLQDSYRQGMKINNLSIFQEKFAKYAGELEQKQNDYNNAIDSLRSKGYGELKEGEYGPTIPIDRFLIDTKTAENKVNPESLKVLSAIYKPEDVKTLAESAQSRLDVQAARIDFLDNAVAQRTLGFSNELALDEAMDVAGINRKEKAESPIGFNLIGTEAEVPSRYIWPQLTQEQKDKVASAFENIPGRDSPLAMAINEYNKILSEIPAGKYLSVATALLVPPVGMPLLAAETVANVVAPYTISNDSIRRQINSNADYFNNADKLTPEEEKILADTLNNGGLRYTGNPLDVYKSLQDAKKNEVMTDLTREQLGLSVSTMDKVLAGAMVVASVLPYVNIAARIGRVGSFAIHAPITGLFIASSVNTIKNPQASVEDKVISGLFAVLMARGMIKGLTVPKVADNQLIVKKMAETLNKPSTPGISVQARVQELAKNITQGIVEAKDKVNKANKLIDQMDNIDIEKITQDAIAKGKYAIGGAKIQAEKYTKTISNLADNIQRKVEQLQTMAGSISAADVEKIIKAEIAKGKYALRGMEIKGGQYTEAFNNGARSLQRKLAQLQTKVDSIEASDIQRIIENTIGKARYNLESIARTKTAEIQRVAENIKQSVQREITRLQIKAGNISLADVEKIINDTLANGQYKLGGVKIKAAELEKIAQDIRQSVVSKVTQLQTKARSISAADVERVITDALSSGKYKLGDTKIKIEELAGEIKSIAAEVESKINRIRAKVGDISIDDVEKVISDTISKGKYHLGGIKLTGEAAIKGVKEVLEAQKGISPQKLEKLINDLEKAIKSGNADAVKKAGENISNIAKQSPNEKAGEALGKQGQVIRDKAAEIVKEAERRLNPKQISDIENSLKESGDFLESPTEYKIKRAMKQRENIDNTIRDIKSKIRSTQSMINKTEYELENKPKPPTENAPKLTKAQVEAEKLRLMFENSRLNVDLYRLHNQGGEPGDMQRIQSRIQRNLNRLAELEKTYNTEKPIDKAKLKEAYKEELARLKQQLSKYEATKALSERQTLKEKLWGEKVVGNEQPPREPRGRPEPLKPEEPQGGGKSTKVKTEVKPKTAEELEKELLPKEKGTEKEKPTGTEKKPEAKPKEKPSETKPKEKTTTKTDKTTETPIKIPRVVSEGYAALVWENGHVFVKWVAPEILQEGYVGTGPGPQRNPILEERLRELMKTMSPQEAAKIIAREFPNADYYPVYFQSPQKQGISSQIAVYPQPEPAKEKVKSPVESPVKEKTPSPEPVLMPSKLPTPYPPPIPELKPEPVKPKPPQKIPSKVTEREHNRRHHEPTSEDKDKRALIRNAHSAVTYKRGELRGKGVWHTWLKKTKDSDWERAVVLGAKPEGAFYATGPGSATKTMQRLSGGSRININEDTGAVDTVLHGGEGEKVQIRFVPDKSIKREWRLKERQHSTYIRKARKAKEVYLGAGVVQEGLSGRRHIKIKGVRRL